MALNIDRIDAKIISALEEDSRQPNKSIAKRIGSNEHLVAYRIERLLKEGIIKKIYCVINRGMIYNLGYRIFLKLQASSPEKELELAKRIADDRHSCWVSFCFGQWDLVCSVFAKSPKEFSETFSSMTKGFEGIIQEKQVLSFLETAIFNRKYILEGRNAFGMQEYDGRMKALKLDKTDFKILQQLSNNSRIPTTRLAEKLKVSPDTVRNRIKKLEQKKVILGHGVLLDYGKIGMKSVLVMVNLNSTTKERENAIFGFAKYHPNVNYWLKFIGAYDLCLELEIEENMIAGFLKEFKGKFHDIIKNSEALIMAEEFKYTYISQAQ